MMKGSLGKSTKRKHKENQGKEEEEKENYNSLRVAIEWKKDVLS